jgi:hypothetical protein
VLSDLGYGGLKLAEVCNRLGVTTGSFYHYFSGWPAYTRELVAHWMRERTVQVIEVVSAEPDPRRRIDSLIQVGLSLPHGAEAAIRSWSSVDSDVYAAQVEVDQQRFDIVYESAFEILHNKRQAELFADWGSICWSATSKPPWPGTQMRWRGSSGNSSTLSIPVVSPPFPTMTNAISDTGRPVEHVVALLRERLYGAISCLGTLAVLARYTTEDTSAWSRVLDVAVATGGLWAASLLADWVAHLSVHGDAPRGRTALRVLGTSGQILEAAFAPLLVLVAAGIGVLCTSTAMWIAIWILIAELGVIAFLAVRRTQLPWWQQLLTVAGLIGVGVLVVGVKIVAH